MFSRKHVANGETRVCDFNPLNPRASRYFDLLDAGIDSGDPRRFTEAARDLAMSPPCPRAEPTRSLFWYRNDIYACCPECHAALIRDTKLDRQMFPVHRNEQVGWEMPLKCDFWSPRIRGMCKETISNGDLTKFNNFMNHRLQIFAKTWPEANTLRGQVRNQSMQQLNMYQNSFSKLSRILSTSYSHAPNVSRQSPLIYLPDLASRCFPPAILKQLLTLNVVVMSIGSSVAGAAGTSSSYGNSSIGFHPTMAGAEAAQLFNQASSMGSGSGNGAVFARIDELDALWKTVE